MVFEVEPRSEKDGRDGPTRNLLLLPLAIGKEGAGVGFLGLAFCCAALAAACSALRLS